jgi:hypothetical protein
MTMKGFSSHRPRRAKVSLAGHGVEFDAGAAGLEIVLQRRVQRDMLEVVLGLHALSGIVAGMVAAVAPVPDVAVGMVEPHVHEERGQAAGEVLHDLHGHGGVGVGLGGADGWFLGSVPVVGIVQDHLGHVAEADVFGQFALALESAEVEALVLVDLAHGDVEAICRDSVSSVSMSPSQRMRLPSIFLNHCSPWRPRPRRPAPWP